jgi:hypothetical protein
VLWPPILGQRSVQWSQVFALIVQCDEVWDTWKCSKTLDKMTLGELWACWNVGEDACGSNGEVTGRKPPLRLIEQHFGSKWHTAPTVSVVLGPCCRGYSLIPKIGTKVVGTNPRDPRVD